MQQMTVRGHVLGEVASAMQKAIRRSDARLAGYWAVELWDSGYYKYVWKRLLIISAEDCFDAVTREVLALKEAHDVVYQKGKRDGVLFVVKAAILLAEARKCRDADHIICIAYDRREVSDSEAASWIEDVRRDPLPIPDYALDCHTSAGRRAGKTKEDFLRDEYRALKPRQPGLFDVMLEKL